LHLDAEHWLWVEQEDETRAAERFREVFGSQREGRGASADAQPVSN